MDTLNLNVGLLGHVDSGKTSLAKALSQISSTAAFDKDPQAKERGITLDLGFSCFTVDLPIGFSDFIPYPKVQFTLVDCPGHASLIKTIVGGAHIIDIMLLVIDATKGIQPQASECLLLCEITDKKMIVVVNKSDLVTEAALEKLIKKLKATIERTSIRSALVVTASALNSDVEKVIDALKKTVFLPKRNINAPFLFAIDHCFGIKGKGTVLTGTILQGTVKINDIIEIQNINQQKKVKSLQMFKNPVKTAVQGDRVGICVTQFEPKLIERGLANAPGFVRKVTAAVMEFNSVQYFTSKIASNTTFNINVGYENIMANIILFEDDSDDMSNFIEYKQYKYIEEIADVIQISDKRIFVLLEFSKPIPLLKESLAIGMKLDAPVTSCRLAFYGRIVYIFGTRNYEKERRKYFRIYKEKCKLGYLDRIMSETDIIGRNMFKRETNVHKFVGEIVTLATGEMGIIEGPFGKTGKFKVRVPDGMGYTFIPREVKENTDGIQITMIRRHFIFEDN